MRCFPSLIKMNYCTGDNDDGFKDVINIGQEAIALFFG